MYFGVTIDHVICKLIFLSSISSHVEFLCSYDWSQRKASDMTLKIKRYILLLVDINVLIPDRCCELKCETFFRLNCAHNSNFT